MGKSRRSNKVFKKRKFTGNRHTRRDEESSETSNLENPRGLNGCSSGIEERRPSTSKRKLVHLEEGEEEQQLDSGSVNNGNIIINIKLLCDFVNRNTSCKHCNSTDTFVIEEDTSVRLGLSSKLRITCKNCNLCDSTRTSETTCDRFYDINLRMVYGMRCIGKGQKSAELLCGILDLPPPPAKFNDYIGKILKHTTDVSDNSMRIAARETVTANDGDSDLTVTFDGTLQKRGHNSHHGVVAATSYDTGKILDVEILTNYCRGCKLNQEDHKCVKNYEGSSGGMEAAGAMEIFQRSVSERGVRYINYLGDGDSKAYKTVCESKPYGEDVQIEKLECVGHVQKRLGSRLRKLKKEMKGKRLEDGKVIGGAGRLTDSEIDKLQTYYGLAIRRNIHNLADMKKAVWASFLHKASTDSYPQHQFCPKGPDSWCGYQKAVDSAETYKHKHSLPNVVLEAMKPIYKDLCEDKLLTKCLHGHTQNLNESFNNCVWERLPKTVFVEYNVLKIGVYDAVLCFNDGALSRLKVLNEMGVKVSSNTQEALKKIDNSRVFYAERAAESATKESRTKRRLQQKQKEDEQCNEYDYGPGMF